MNKGFWQDLDKPIVGLSPMDGVTDAPWRFIAKKYGKPDVIYTEFVSAEGLWRVQRRGEMEHRIWSELWFDKTERPIVAQIFGSDPESFYISAKIVAEMGFDGIDINMGCPSPGLERRGGGAGLIREPALAKKIVEETRRGVYEYASEKGVAEIPVSLKTRIGSEKIDLEWWKQIAVWQMPVVAMHGRTFKQLYSGKADWESLARASSIIRESGTIFLANGDIKKMLQGNRVELNDGDVVYLDGVFDGVLIGRSVMGNPWALRKEGVAVDIKEKMRVAVEHAYKFEEVFGRGKFFPIRKHLTWYAHGMENATELRQKLVRCESAAEVEKVVSDWGL